MDLDLRDLELIEAVDQHGTLTAAATHLYVSQPALSQRLTRLEQRVGAPLFERTARRLIPTPAGKRMIQAARTSLHELRDAIRDIAGLQTDPAGAIRLATQCVTNFQWLPLVLHQFRQQHPTADIEIVSVADNTHVDALIAGEVDVAIVTKFEQHMELIRLHELFDDEMLAIVAPDHPWARRPYVEVDDFQAAHLVMCDSYDPERVPATPLPTPDQVQPARLTLLPLVTDMIIETIVASDAITIMPSWNAAPYLASGRVAATQIGRTPQGRTWYAATRREPLDHITVDLVVIMRATLHADEHHRFDTLPAG